MKKFFRKENFLISLAIFAFAIRIFGVENNPPSLNWDEVSHGYNAYSILTTGRDEWGTHLPTIFRAYGDYKLPAYIYTTAISIFLFGINTLAVRLPSVLAGTGSVLFTYLLVRKLFKNELLSVFSGLSMAIAPWSFFLSRIAVEANLALFFIISGSFFYLTGLEDKKTKNLLLGLLMFCLSVWTYNSARIFTPLILISLVIVYLNEHKKYFISPSHTTYYILLTTLFFLPMFIQLVNPAGQARYGNVKILNEGAIGRIEEQRNTSSLPPSLKRAFYNRPVYFSEVFIKNYLEHFTPSFLFINGGNNFQFNVQGAGLLYLVDLPLFFIGLFFCFKDFRNNKGLKVILAWILLAPIAGSVTREAPHTLRSIVMLPTPMILTALGFQKSYNFLANFRAYKYSLATLATYLYAILLILFVVGYLVKLDDYRSKYSWAWQYGNVGLTTYLNNNYQNFDKIIISKVYGEPHEFLLFYGAKNNSPWHWQSNKYREDENLIRFNQSNWWWVDRFDKFYFVNNWDIPLESSSTFTMESGGQVACRDFENCLLITSPLNAPPNWQKIETINFLSGEGAYEVYSN